MDRIDLRSDTVSWPTPEMRRAMAEAPVGDDVFGEDPTVNRLQERAAERLGKEAGLFVASGTMGNLVAVLAHCGRGDEVILGDRAHTHVYEAGGIAALGGVHPRAVPVQPDGTLPLDAIRAAIRPDDVHFPRTRLIALENTQGTVGGIPVPKSYIDAVGALAREHGITLHIDGARIFNAATALRCDVADLVSAADSVTFCLSKGLCAPVGSVLVGSRAFIDEARRARKIVGGGMRQAGILAAAGVVALETMVDRLADDHSRARRLAEGLALLPGISVGPVHTNILYFSLDASCPLDGAGLAAALHERGILLPNRGPRSFRAVTHCWISDADVECTLTAVAEIVAAA